MSSTFHLKTIPSLIFLFVTCNGFGQENFSALGETAFSLNKGISKDYTLNFTLRSRYFLYQNTNTQYQQQQVDAFHFSKLKLNKHNSLSLGVYYRTRTPFNSGSNELRIMQQYSYNKQKKRLKYGHRFRTEQRFLKAKTIYRERYRFSTSIPLCGETIDIGETFLISYLEGLLSLSKLQKPETDVRLTTQIGWQITEDLKLKTGLEHRLEAFNLEAKNNLFILTSATLRI